MVGVCELPLLDFPQKPLVRGDSACSAGNKRATVAGNVPLGFLGAQRTSKKSISERIEELKKQGIAARSSLTRRPYLHPLITQGRKKVLRTPYSYSLSLSYLGELGSDFFSYRGRMPKLHRAPSPALRSVCPAMTMVTTITGDRLVALSTGVHFLSQTVRSASRGLID